MERRKAQGPQGLPKRNYPHRESNPGSSASGGHVTDSTTDALTTGPHGLIQKGAQHLLLRPRDDAAPREVAEAQVRLLRLAPPREPLPGEREGLRQGLEAAQPREELGVEPNAAKLCCAAFSAGFRMETGRHGERLQRGGLSDSHSLRAQSPSFDAASDHLCNASSGVCSHLFN